MKKTILKKVIQATMVALAFVASSAWAETLEIKIMPGEYWWHGLTALGHEGPYDASSVVSHDLWGDNQGNQAQPLLISSQGRFVWSEQPFKYVFDHGKITVTTREGRILSGVEGKNLKEIYGHVSKRFFPPAGKMPDEWMFSRPQYNTWIELTYNQNQADILKYARGIIANGFPPGVLMIDDTWQEDYGVWDFNPGRFSDPKQMMDELHALGFKVMLWVCPFVSADQARLVRQLLKDKCFLMEQKKPQTTWKTADDPAIIKWWNGYSALLDFSNPSAARWFNGQLDRLVEQYGVDGFKLDAGDMNFYPPEALSMESATPNRQCELYARLGLKFPLNEYRACWKMAGQPLAQRLRDKNHSWEDVQKLIPQMLTASLAGYTFCCPDMIGGGDYGSFLDLKKVDQDLIVRSAQIHALMPMMQFSLAPWRVLDAKHLAAVKTAAAIREHFAPTILELARASAKTGEPIVRPLEYEFPHQGLERVRDEFMLGDSVLVAPMEHNGGERQVILPAGKWVDDDGKRWEGGATYTLPVPLDRIPFFTLQK